LLSMATLANYGIGYMLHISKDGMQIGVPIRPDLKTLFPGAQVLTTGGYNHLVLPNIIDVTRLLRNMGVDAPAPVLSQYAFPHQPSKPPFDVQRKTVAMLTMNKRSYVLNGMGTGKTKAAIWAFDYLKQTKNVNKMLVVAPLSTLNFVWMREVFEICPHLKTVVLHGSKAKRLERLAEDADIYIINHDGIKVMYSDLMARTDIDMLCVDEISEFRNSMSAKTKVLARISARMVYAFGMTGSPTPKEPTDVYGQAKIITPSTVGQYFGRWRDTMMVKVSNFKWVPRPDAVGKAFAALQPAVRYTLEDVMELPEVVERAIEVPMGVKQAEVYSKMVAHSKFMIAAGEVTASNAGVLVTKLLQIALGYVYDNHKAVIKLDNDARLDRMIDDVHACADKVIIFVPYIHALKGIMERLTKDGIDCVHVSGDTPQGKRSEIFNLFQNTNKYKVLAAHPRCMSHGLTLTAATLIIWFGPVLSLDTFLQANARISRVGQKKKQLIHSYYGSLQEKKIINMLRGRQIVQNKLLDLFEEDSE